MAFAALGDARQAWQVLDLINPLNHGRTAREVALYKVEPYVVAADVYGVAPHAGRGGWSWYTGAAGWMYRLVLESLLGLRLRIDAGGAWLAIAPCVPAHWKAYAIDYRFRSATYQIEVHLAPEPDTALLLTVDDQAVPGAELALVDDGQVHRVQVRVAAAQPVPGAAPLPEGGTGLPVAPPPA